MRRSYAGAAQSAKLTDDLGASTADVTIYCDDLTNWPTGVGGYPFYIAIDRGKSNEEKILCSSRTGNVLTVYDDGLTNGRAADGTSITAHTANATVEHVATATDADEANAHVNTASLHIQSGQTAITTCTSTTRPGSPTLNQVILETDTLAMLMWDGSVWEPVTSTSQGGYPDLFLLMGA